MALYGDVRTLRQSLEPALLSLSPARFAELQADWRDKEKDAPTNAEVREPPLGVWSAL
jgi:hypothetical protein